MKSFSKSVLHALLAILLVSFMVNACADGQTSGEWVCPSCGRTVSGNFCNKCGTPKPIDAQHTSEPTAASTSTPMPEATSITSEQGEESSASVIDLSSMSLNELYILQTNVNLEIEARSQGNNSALYPGGYVAGRDIEAGGYIITCTEINDGNSSCCLDVFYSEDAYKSLDYSNGEYRYLSLNDSYFVSLDEGMVLYFYRGNGTITPAKKFITETPVLYPGAYVVGKDIPEGKYLVTCTSVEEGHNSCCLDMFYSENAYRSLDYSNGEYHYLKQGENYFANLTSGMVLYFYRGTGNIQAQ